MPRRVDLANERKNQIVVATLNCITDLGYNHFSMQDVARNAGLSKGIIHYYFKNKQELMTSVLGTVTADITNSLSLIKADLDPVQRICEMVRVYFRIVEKNPSQYRINIDFWAQINQCPEFKEIIAKHYQDIRESTLSILRPGYQTGAYKEGIDLDYAASMIVGLIDGMSLQWLFDSEQFNFDKMVKKCEDMIVNFLIKND